MTKREAKKKKLYGWVASNSDVFEKLAKITSFLIILIDIQFYSINFPWIGWYSDGYSISTIFCLLFFMQLKGYFILQDGNKPKLTILSTIVVYNFRYIRGKIEVLDNI